MGLMFGNGAVDLAGAVANKFSRKRGRQRAMFGPPAAGLGRQDSIAGTVSAPSVTDIVVDSGTVGTGVSSVHHLPAARDVFRHWVPERLVIGLGVNVSLDTGLVMAFDTSAALSVGDFGTPPCHERQYRQLRLARHRRPACGVAQNPAGSSGVGGIFLGSQSGTPIVRHLRLVRGGSSAVGQVCQNCLIKTTGFFEPLNTSLFVDAPNGTAPFTIDSWRAIPAICTASR